MTLNQDEIRDVLKSLIRCSIDLNQGMNYCVDSKYNQGTANFHQTIKALEDIIEKIKS